MSQGGYHINVNVLDRDMLLDAMKNPDKYPKPDDSRQRLRGELHQTHPSPADGRHYPHVPPATKDDKLV